MVVMIYGNSFSDKLSIKFTILLTNMDFPHCQFPGRLVQGRECWLVWCLIIIQNYKFSSPLHIRLYPIVFLSPCPMSNPWPAPTLPGLCGAKIRWKKFSQRKNKQRQACMQIGDNLVMFLAEGMWGRGNGWRGEWGVSGVWVLKILELRPLSLSLSSDKRGSTSNMSCLLFVVDENVCPLHVTQLCQAHVAPPAPSCSCLHSKQTSHGQMKK